jgi:Hsp70 protein
MQAFDCVRLRYDLHWSCLGTNSESNLPSTCFDFEDAKSSKPETQSLIVEWPSTNGSLAGVTNDKVPTEISYNGLDVNWGFQVPEDDLRYQWFKLDLNPKIHNDISYLSVEYPDPKAAPPSYDKTAEKLTIDYLDSVRCHIMKVLKIKLGQVLLDTTPIGFVITVPAIRSEAARYRTRECAKRAGMGNDLQIVSEPEAAVIYTLDVMNPARLHVGDTFVVCDAGGGTVDLISYRIDSTYPRVKISEAAPGSGSACGSTFLNRIFRKWLETNFSDNPGWGEDTLEDAVTRFETIVKSKFDGEDGEFIVNVAGLADDPSKGVKRNKLTLSSGTLRQIFEPVISTITALVKMQVSLTPTVKAILLVGGFGQSPYLRETLRKLVDYHVEIMQPTNGWTAVARGALIKGLAEACPTVSRIAVGSRVARKAYGCRVSVVYDPAEHPSELK